MKVLIVGGGGREHALAWKAAQSKLVDCVYVAPGNAGTALEACIENVAINAEDIDALARFALEHQIDLTIIGPEVPLVMGVVDLFAQHGLQCFGPNRESARLEGSKVFAKDFLQRHAIPTATYASFTDTQPALEYLDTCAYPLVIKADGLAAGKGVIIAETVQHAVDAITSMLSENRFGDAGNRIVIEEFLDGEEASFICIVDGETILPMASSQDHKAAHDGDTGPNTGGMGAYSPAPIVDEAMHERIIEQVIRPTLRGLVADGMRYTGFLYAGIMIGRDQIPKVLEFNCRFGDPETQPIMLRMQSDLVAHCLAALSGKLEHERAEWDDRYALGVVMAAAGYPGKYETGNPIYGLEQNCVRGHVHDGHVHDEHVHGKVFHSGTAIENEQLVASGGRVLCACALGDNVCAASEAAYRLVDKINCEGIWYRADIGHRAIARENVAHVREA